MRNGRSSIAAVSASAIASAARSALPTSPETLSASSGVRARSAPSQNGASVAAAAWAPGTSPAAIAASSSRARAGEVSARFAKACSRGHTTTAARWYQRSRVLPQLPM